MVSSAGIVLGAILVLISLFLAMIALFVYRNRRRRRREYIRMDPFAHSPSSSCDSRRISLPPKALLHDFQFFEGGTGETVMELKGNDLRHVEVRNFSQKFEPIPPIRRHSTLGVTLAKIGL